jgi:hypothetical protein
MTQVLVSSRKKYAWIKLKLILKSWEEYIHV